MDPSYPNYENQYAPIDERRMYQLDQHYREGTHHLEVDQFQRRGQEVNICLAP